jgi:ankyrin repeat protein
MWAAYKGHEEVVKALITYNANPHIKNYRRYWGEGATAAMLAKYGGNMRIYRMLLEYEKSWTPSKNKK